MTEKEGTSGANPNTPSLSNEDMAKRDYKIAIDKSGSMTKNDTPNGKSRWDYSRENTEALARECEKWDSDGIDVLFFNNTIGEHKNVTAAAVEKVYKEHSPAHSTDTAGLLRHIFSDYLERKSKGAVKPVTLIVVTDGEPDDQKAVDKVIVDFTQKLDSDDEFGITFLQVGKDESCRKFLKHLDDDLQAAGAKYDIVDTKNDEEMGKLSYYEILVEAVTD